MSDDHTATEVAEQLEQIRENSALYNTIDGFDESFTAFTREVVEGGTFTPDPRVNAELSLTYKQRLTGTRKQDMTAMVVLGMMIGAALERDVPKDSGEEKAWKAGNFELPEDA